MIEKLKTYYNKYVNWIVIILLILFGLKSCQSCQRGRQIKFYKQSSELVVDSLKDDIRYVDKYSDSLKNEIRVYKSEIKARENEIKTLKEENTLLRESNNHYKQVNKKLIDNINKEN